MDCREVQELLTAFHDGELTPTERARVEEHLRGCVECGVLLADLARADRAAGVPDPGPEYWSRFNARVMGRVTRENEGQGWAGAGTGRDAPGFEAPAGPKGTTLRPKRGWIRQQVRYLVPAAAVAALVVAVVRYGGMPPVSESRPTARDGLVPGQAGMPPVSESRPAPAPAERDRTGAKAAPSTPKKGENTAVPPPAHKVAVPDERFAAAAREERERQADRSPPSGKMEVSEPRPMAFRSAAGPSPVTAPDEPRPDLQAERKKAEASATLMKGRPSAGASRDATGLVAPADGQGRPSAGASRDATGIVAPAEISPCDRARTLANRERFREAEDAQRACLAGDLSAPSREKGLVFLAELLDRQARFTDADAVIAEVDRRFPKSRPLDLYRQQRPMVQKHPIAVPVTR